MNYKEFLIGVDIIEKTLNRKFTEGQLETYFLLLQNLEVEKYKNGLVRLLSERVYTNIPAPAEIIQYSKGNKKEDIENKIAIAKDKLQYAIKKGSAYTTTAFDDPIIHKIIESLGGWIKLMCMDLEELKNFMKFEFEKTYKAYLENGNIGETKIMFLGKYDCKNDTQPEIPYIFGEVEAWKRWSNAMKHKQLKNYEQKKQIENMNNIKTVR